MNFKMKRGIVLNSTKRFVRDIVLLAIVVVLLGGVMFSLYLSTVNNSAEMGEPSSEESSQIAESLPSSEPQIESSFISSSSSNVESNLVNKSEASSEVESEPEEEVYIKLTAEERDMLAKLIYLEGRGESYECQLAIGSVVLNRLANGYWGDTLEEVIYSPHQFTPAKSIVHTTAGKRQYEVVDYLIKNGPTIPYYVMYFRARHYFKWGVPYMHLDNTYFTYQLKDKKD
jgi:hypothetical protein